MNASKGIEPYRESDAPWNTPVGLALFASQTHADRKGQMSALRTIATALAESDQIERAVELVDRIECPYLTACALRAVASAQTRAGNTYHALAILKRTATLAEGEKDARRKSELLVSIASAYIEAADEQHALTTLKRAVETTQTIRHASIAARLFASVGTAQARAGSRQEALATLAQAEDMARMEMEPVYQSSALCRVAEALAKAKETAQAIKLAREIERRITRVRALGAVAAGATATGDERLARAILAEIVKTARDETNPHWKAMMLETAGRGLAELGDTGPAVTGQADTGASRHGSAPSGGDGQDNQPPLRRSRCSRRYCGRTSCSGSHREPRTDFE